MSRCQIVAHRGASFQAPENTLAAFRLAWKNGIRIVEGDFRLTSDRRVVCIHDDRTARVGDADLLVSSSSLSQLRSLDVGAWKGDAWVGAKIPTLDEILAEMPDESSLFLEVKCGVELLDVLQEFSFDPERVIIISFKKDVLMHSKKVMPDVKVLWLSGYSRSFPGRRVDPNLNKVLESLEKSGFDGFGSQQDPVLDSNFIDALHERDKEVNVWTVDDVIDAKQYLAAGVDYLTTNRPMYIRDNLGLG